MKIVKDITAVRYNHCNPDHQSLPYITSSMLDGINTCPKRGILRNVLRKTFTTGYRQMALEAGSLMHEVLSVLNFYQLGYVNGFPEHMHHHAQQELGISRWKHIHDGPHKAYMDNIYDENTFIENMCMNCIGSSDFVDDPSDPKRTLANLEACTVVLIDYWMHNLRDHNIYVQDPNDPTAPVGIEISIQIVVTALLTDTVTGELTTRSFRFIGLADILYQLSNHALRLGEFKTAATMNDAWRMAFETRHQITGYHLGIASMFPEENVDDECILIGQGIPLLKSRANNIHFPVYREPIHKKAFGTACLHALDMIDAYKDIPQHAPMFTHSCNAYFRPCAYLDVCTSAEDDQIEMIAQMHTSDDMSPSEEKAMRRHE